MTTKNKIIEAATAQFGNFVDTDGAWCMTRTPAEFKEFLEKEFGFDIVECRETAGSTAVAKTAEGIKISWNGHCSLDK